MTTTPLMNMILPDDHGSNELWGLILNTIFSSRIDVHNHTVGLGARIPTAGLSIDADLSFSPIGTPWAITDLKAIDFAAVAASAVAGLAGAFFLSDGSGGLVANELYYRTTGGSNVRVTSGSALNVAAFVGGIGGDYSAISALLDYDDATDTYRFRQETAAAVRQFAKMRCADLQLVEYDPAGDASVPAFAVTLKSPDALAAAYDVTWPVAVPGSTQLMQMSSSGALTASNTVVNTVTLSSPLAADTISAAGLIFGQNGLTAAVNTHMTVSGTGRYLHGLESMPFAISNTNAVVLGGGVSANPGGLAGAVLGAGAQIFFPMPAVPRSKRLVNVHVYFPSTTDRGNVNAIQVYVTNNGDPMAATFGSLGATFSNTGTAVKSATGINHQLQVASTLWLRVDSVSSLTVISGIMEYDGP